MRSETHPPATPMGIDETLDKARQLIEKEEFKAARRLLSAARVRAEANSGTPESDLDSIVHEQIRASYRDPEAASDLAIEEGWSLLTDRFKLKPDDDARTLYLAGQLQKHQWRRMGRWLNLRRALHYYRTGYEAERDDEDYRWSNGINAAFTLDELARHEERALDLPPGALNLPSNTEEAIDVGQAPEGGNWARALRDQAHALRAELTKDLEARHERLGDEGMSWRQLRSLAEAHFGMGDYESASKWLEKVRPPLQEGVAAEPWQLPDDIELQRAARQLVNLGRLQGVRPEVDLTAFVREDMDEEQRARAEAARQALHVLLDGADEDALETAFTGKVGLALSGGGFRAALFHIGALAALADRNILRHVQVLSCVSGGSIVGTQYYLELKSLLEQRGDKEITPHDYVMIVQKLADDMVAGVQRNLRTRIFSNLFKSAKMLRSDYSPSARLGELLERELFTRAGESHRREPIWLNEIKIAPKDEPPAGGPEFKPKHNNWRRRNKVPILVINATTLNTGHSWQFTASHMGEPPTSITGEIDSNQRLERIVFTPANRQSWRGVVSVRRNRDEGSQLIKPWRRTPAAWKQVRLGQAVAASAAVPGAFEPIPMRNIYDGWVVRLADGGVHDNQGISGVLEQDCDVIMVSDASGPLHSQRAPAGGLLSVPLRTNTILMQRVRTAQYEQLRTRERSGLVRGSFFLHLTRDLEPPPVPAVAFEEETDEEEDHLPTGNTTRYGVFKPVQEGLARLRTDLDSFCEVEAFALMTSGYLMAVDSLRAGIGPFPGDDKYDHGGEDDWQEKMAPIHRDDDAAERWSFLKMRSVMGSPDKLSANGRVAQERLLSHLEVGRRRTQKFMQNRGGRIVTKALGLAVLVAGLLFLTSSVWGDPWEMSGDWGIRAFFVGVPLLSLAALFVLGFVMSRVGKTGDRPTTFVGKSLTFLVAAAYWPFANLHLLVTDHLYRWQGRVKRLFP